MNRSAEDAKYSDLRGAIASKGYRVVPVPFFWNYKTVAQYVEKFIPFYDKHKSEHNTIIGNSYGAMVAFLAAPKLKPDKILLCSLSPFFKEDQDKTTLKYRLRRFGKRREKAMGSLSATQTAKAINQTNTKIIMLYGEQEKTLYPELVQRASHTNKELENARLIEIAGAPHSFNDPAYIKSIKLALNE